MKLANALAQRAHLQLRLSELEKRLQNNAKVQAGETPAEDPQALLTETDSILQELESLIAQINLVNSTTIVDGMPLTSWLARRDCLRQRLTLMRNFLNIASERVNRYSKSEVVIQSTVDVAKLQKEVDTYSRQLREVDEKIQEANWTTELEEPAEF